MKYGRNSTTEKSDKFIGLNVELQGLDRTLASSQTLKFLTNPKVRTNSYKDTNTACHSAVTSGRFAYNSPNAVLLAVMWNTDRVKRATSDLVQAAAGAKSFLVSSCIKACNARGARAQTRT